MMSRSCPSIDREAAVRVDGLAKGSSCNTASRQDRAYTLRELGSSLDHWTRVPAPSCSSSGSPPWAAGSRCRRHREPIGPVETAVRGHTGVALDTAATFFPRHALRARTRACVRVLVDCEQLKAGDVAVAVTRTTMTRMTRRTRLLLEQLKEKALCGRTLLVNANRWSLEPFSHVGSIE